MVVAPGGQRVLLVGWGFIGAAVGHRLRNDGADVVALTRRASDRSDAAVRAGVDVHFGPVDHPSVVDRHLDGVDHVIFAAGGLLPADAAKDPLRDASETIVPWLATLEAVKNHPHIGVTLVSSGGTVYGNPRRIPVREDDVTAPVSAYGASRLACTTYAGSYRATHGLRIQVVRCANAYGPGQPHDRSQGAVAVFLHRLRCNLPITIFGDGSAIRDYVYIDDVAAAVAHLASAGSDIEAVNVGSGRGHTTMELLETLMALTGRRTAVTHAPERPHDVRQIVLDIGSLRSLMDYRPLALEEGLTLTCAHQGVPVPGLLAPDWEPSFSNRP